MTPTSPSGTLIARSKTGNRFVTEEPDGLFYVWSPNLNGIGISWTYAFRTKTAAISQMRGMSQHAHNGITSDEDQPEYSPNEDLAWREVYARAYKEASAEGLEDWRAREEASRAAWADYEARTGQVPNDSLHRRIAATLGWTESSTRSMSLASLRDLVRPVDPALAEEIGERIRSGRHIRQPGGAQRSQAELWRQMFGREPPAQRPNGSGYYVWALARSSNEPLTEGPWGPYETLESAKTFARIGATEGAHDRAVSLGFDPESSTFRLVRRYQARTGERLL